MPSSRSRFTVIIPARNEEAYIEKSIESIRAQDYPEPAQIIVVDNASIDATSEVAEHLGAKVVKETRVGLPRARETGRLAAHGEILVYLDADTTLPKNYLSTIDSVFRTKPNVVAISNPFKFYDGTAGQQLIVSFFFKVIHPVQNFLFTLMGKSHILIGGSFAARAKSLEEIGGFNTNIIFAGEDLAISKELATVGDIKILSDLLAQTSARRYIAHGTLKTCGMYVKNFFSVLLINKASDGTIIRRILKIIILSVVLILIIRHFHLVHLLRTDLDQNAAYLGAALLALLGFEIFHPRSQLFGPVTGSFNTSEKIVALTFDDGPSEKSTQKVLDILKQEGLPATFFVVGKNAQAHPEIVKEIVKSGHEIANHSYKHSWLFPFLSSAKIVHEVDRTQHIIEDVVGKGKMKKIFRPPHGWRTPWMLARLKEKDYQVVTWDVGMDYKLRATRDKITSHYTKKTKPGSILLFHDAIWERPNDDRNNLITALPEVIKELKKQGYKFVLVSDML